MRLNLLCLTVAFHLSKAFSSAPVFSSAKPFAKPVGAGWENHRSILSTIHKQPNLPSCSSHSSTQCSASALSTVVSTLRGGAGGEQFVGEVYDWCVNLGAPAALVAGAVVATLYENIRAGALVVTKKDTKYGRFAKRLTSLLLLSAFALQIVSIFVTTVTGTMILSRDMSKLPTVATTSLGFLRENFEFEYMTSRISFLQGLLNWIGAVALEFTIPNEEDGPATKKMNNLVASSLFTLLFFILSFYNNHMNFYDNYFHMLKRWTVVTAKRYFGQWPPRPMAVLMLPGMIWTVISGYRAFTVEPTDKDRPKDD